MNEVNPQGLSRNVGKQLFRVSGKRNLLDLILEEPKNRYRHHKSHYGKWGRKS